MNARFINISQARKVSGNELGKLSPVAQEALAYAQSVGTKATAAAAGKQSWTLTAIAAVEIQEAFADKAERSTAWVQHKADVTDALRGKVIGELVSQLGLHRDVKAGKAEDKSPLTELQSTLVKAQTQLDNYTNRIAAAWDAGIKVKFDTLTNGTIVPESAGKLQDRTREAKAATAVKTPDSKVKESAGKLAGNIQGFASEIHTEEGATAFIRFMAAAEAIMLRVIAGRISEEELNEISGQLEPIGAEEAAQEIEGEEKAEAEGEALTNLEPDESKEAEEVREELGIAVGA